MSSSGQKVFIIDVEEVSDNFDMNIRFNESFANVGRILTENFKADYDFSDML